MSAGTRIKLFIEDNWKWVAGAFVVLVVLGYTLCYQTAEAAQEAAVSGSEGIPIYVWIIAAAAGLFLAWKLGVFEGDRKARPPQPAQPSTPSQPQTPVVVVQPGQPPATDPKRTSGGGVVVPATEEPGASPINAATGYVDFLGPNDQLERHMVVEGVQRTDGSLADGERIVARVQHVNIASGTMKDGRFEADVSLVPQMDDRGVRVTVGNQVLQHQPIALLLPGDNIERIPDEMVETFLVINGEEIPDAPSNQEPFITEPISDGDTITMEWGVVGEQRTSQRASLTARSLDPSKAKLTNVRGTAYVESEELDDTEWAQWNLMNAVRKPVVTSIVDVIAKGDDAYVRVQYRFFGQNRLAEIPVKVG